MVPGQEFSKILPVYPVVTVREPERWQALFFNPPQYGYRADPTALGNKTGSNILWAPLFQTIVHVRLPII
jgi:hypothetical protein